MDLRDKFLSASKELLSFKGFIQDDNRPRFSLRTASIVKVLAFDIDTKGLCFNIKPQLLVSHDEISRIRKGFDDLKHKRDYYSTVIEHQYTLAELYQKPAFKVLGHIVKDENSLQSSINNFKSFMDEIGFCFFDRFKTIADFDQWFSEPILKGTYDFKRGNILNFAVEGLVAAKINQNPNYEKIYEIWMKSISPDFTEARGILKSLKAYLDNYKAEV